MKLPKFGVKAAVMTVATCFGFSAAAMAEFPERPIQIINPWAPGDSADIVMRKAAEYMSEDLGVPVKVINRTGGGGIIGATAIATARPDGYTLGLLTPGPAVTQVVMGNTTYGLDDLKPVGIFWDSPFVLAVRSDEPFSSMKELGDYVNAGNTVTLGSYAQLAVPSLLANIAAEKTGFGYTRIIGLDPVSTLSLGTGDADIVTLPDARALLQDESARGLLTLTNERISTLPDIPTFKEVYGEEASLWTGLFTPRDVPQEVFDVVSKAFQKALEQDEIQEYAKSTGAYAYFLDSEGSSKRIHNEAERFKGMIDKLTN
ncbi:hypothetical protein GCM10011348_33940 [Marinobacterium nitratireducens]|uniref:Tricarboxylate transport protein TctC n=1 Tax=Marinobacterium nitratireducens TaxID=518897 RepID=A0A917ZLQ1_9GAMM|nr:tripartite tricarboxylate transporter substrate binding protein [Marinobacterium nitratireducens]GGO85430.1 hypothetical protein GCM10011348_33940 [Marinobacterium nitratireducens]